MMDPTTNQSDHLDALEVMKPRVDVKVMFLLRGKGIADAIVSIPKSDAYSLRGKNGYRDKNYWDAVASIKFSIARKLRIPKWKETYFHRTEDSISKEPIEILSIKKHPQLTNTLPTKHH